MRPEVTDLIDQINTDVFRFKRLSIYQNKSTIYLWPSVIRPNGIMNEWGEGIVYLCKMVKFLLLSLSFVEGVGTYK